MKHHRVLRIVSKLLIPFIMLFALYVQFHGDFGPGGGFQAGVIMASAFILYGLIFGLENARDLPGLKDLRAAGLLENRPAPGGEPEEAAPEDQGEMFEDEA